MKQRDSKTTGEIIVNREILGGKPIFAGTRIPIHLILDLLADDVRPEEIIKNYYPQLTLKDVQAALKYGARIVEGEEIEFIDKHRIHEVTLR